jgi:CheY-like chemotaxis protein
MMQGTVGVSSSVGKGSRFWFAVTLRKADPAMHGCDPDQDRAVEDLPAAFHGQRVLLVEDDEVNRIVASALLESQGLVVDTAGDGAEAVRKSNSGRYALILMDVQMPEVNGLEATRLIRRAGADPQVPIVGLTAFTLAEDRQRCLDAGMNDHLGKPLVPAHLVTAIRRWMRLQPVPPALLDPPR